jgi:predicted O-methyltransferase YrrM
VYPSKGGLELGSGRDALQALAQYKPLFHPDPAAVAGALENQFTAGPREIDGAGGTSYAISTAVLDYLADLPASDWTSIETGCGYTTVVLANVFGTHICVNPDLASNRLVREFVERHGGATGLRHVEKSSDQGLPELAATGTRVQLALIDGNHSHPFPLLDFHFLDQMLEPGGRLLVDNTEIDAVQELTDYLDLEAAYDLERLIGNCAVYRKVRTRELGWKSQVIRRSPEDVDVARRELARLRMEIAPDLRLALSGAQPLPAEIAPSQSATSPSSPATAPLRRAPTANRAVTGDRLSADALRRQSRRMARWYMSPSGLLAAAALVLLAIGVAAAWPWRLIGVLGVALLAIFLPYKFLREQRRNDAKIRIAIEDGLWRLRTEFERSAAKAKVDLANLARTVKASTEAMDLRSAAAAEALERSTRELLQKVGTIDEDVVGVRQELSALRDQTGELEAAEASSTAQVGVLRGSFQPFPRTIDQNEAKSLCDYWNLRLDLDTGPRHLEYLGRRMLYLEAVCNGRIATSTSDGIIRALAARSINRPDVHVLEIGTLFGLGALFIGDATRPFAERVVLTLLDPFDGYYGGKVDPPTGLAVTRSIVENNFDRLAWPQQDLRILEGYSTDDAILAQASSESYDVVILDGDHSYDGVRLDFERYAPLVRRDGMLIIDDYGTPDWPDVGRYTDDVIRFDNRFDFIGAASRTAIFRRRGRGDSSAD